MKKLLATLVLSLLLSLTVIAQDSDVRDLGGGFQTKTRQVGETTAILIHFPERYYARDLEHISLVKQGTDIAVVKLFGCKPFKDCKPAYVEGTGDKVAVVVGSQAYVIYLLYEGGETVPPVVGVTLVPIYRMRIL